jgi:Swt1-like HEPN
MGEVNGIPAQGHQLDWTQTVPMISKTVKPPENNPGAPPEEAHRPRNGLPASGLALIERRQAPWSIVVLAKQAIAVGHCTTLQNGHTVFGSVFACAALGIAARAFFQRWRRFAGGAETCVFPMISPAASSVTERGQRRCGYSTLAALLRVLDQNWFELSNMLRLPREGRTWVKELQTVRNKWAHISSESNSKRVFAPRCPASGFPPGPFPSDNVAATGRRAR